MRIPTEPPKIHHGFKVHVGSLSVANRTRVVIGQFSLGATASGICEGCCDWLIRGNKFGSGLKQPLVGEKRCVTTQITAAEETKLVGALRKTEHEKF